jgi:hypothetical protein
MHSFSGIINDMIVLGIFVYLLLIISGKAKLPIKSQEKFEALMERNGKLIKALIYIGVVIFTALIILDLFKE